MISKLCEAENVLPLYREYMAYMSQFFDIEDYDAWFDGAMEYLQLYFTETDRHIYVLNKNGKNIGFAFVNSHLKFNKDGYAVAEFYVDKGNERNGYGRELAKYVFTQFRGNWEVLVTRKNKPAHLFWRDVISSFTCGDYAEKEESFYDGYGFLFNNA